MADIVERTYGVKTEVTVAVGPFDLDFTRFVLHFSSKNILHTHLNEDGRRDKEIWRERHAYLITDKIKEISPQKM